MPGLTIPLVLWANGMATRNNIHSRGLFRLNSGPVLQRLECGSRNTEPNQPRRATGGLAITILSQRAAAAPTMPV